MKKRGEAKDILAGISYADLAERSKRGIKWQGISEILIRVFQFLVTIVLARLLGPDEFGLISIALLFTQFAYVVFDFGISAALIQKKEVNALHYSTAFAVNVAMALIWGVVIYRGSGYIAAFFHDPILARMLKILVFIFPLYAMSGIPHTQLTRELRFRRIGLIQLIASGLYGVVAVVMAVRGFGVWSFVYAILAEQMGLTILYIIFSFWKPSLRFRFSALKELLAFGGIVLNTRLLSYFNNRIPTFSFGRWLGTGPLGVYSLVYQLVEFPVQRISKNVLKVIFPVLSKLQEDSDRFRDMVLSAVYYLGLIVVPIFAGLFLVAPELVRLVYGAKWNAAIVPLQILALVGLLRSFWIMNSAVFLSKGKPGIEFKLNILFSLLLVPALYFVFPYGLNRLVLVIAIVWWIAFFTGLKQALQLAAISFPSYMKKLWIAFVATAVFFTVHYTFFLVVRNVSDWIVLTVKVIGSVFIYLLIVRMLDRDIFKKLSDFSRL